MVTLLYYPNTKCKVGCPYCFNEPNGPDIPISAPAMIKSMENLQEKEKGGHVVLHGGEPFLLPFDLFETLVKDLYRYEEKKNKKHVHSTGSSIMTSLAYMTPEHLKLLKKYKIGVGVSMDGPENTTRGPRDEKDHKKFQEKFNTNLKLIKKSNLFSGSITVLTKTNASYEKIDELVKWGIKNKIGGRFNPMFVPWHSCNESAKKLELDVDEITNAFLKLAEATFTYPEFQFALAHEFRNNLLGKRPLSPCIIDRCDYLTTSCRAILGDGSIARCDRCFQDGYYLASIDRPTFVRSEILGQTECKGCRYFEICGGGCPGEPVDNDIRHKTRYCKAYYALYQYIEKSLRIIPDIMLSIDVPNFFNDYCIGSNRNRPFEWWYNLFLKPGQRKFFRADSKEGKKQAKVNAKNRSKQEVCKCQ
jgi:uncharacterized protein